MPPTAKQKLVPRIVGGTDLMAALRQSIADSEKQEKAAVKAPAAAPAKGKKALKRNPDQRELLLPIAGGADKAVAKAPKDEVKKPSKPAAKKAG
jgi:hypothetical protein